VRKILLNRNGGHHGAARAALHILKKELLEKGLLGIDKLQAKL
jgi:hypothetical protein